MCDFDSSENISLNDLNDSNSESMPEVEYSEPVNTAFDAETNDVNDYLFESHITMMDSEDMPVEYDDLPKETPFSYDADNEITVDYDELPEEEGLTDSQISRLEDLEEGYQPVVQDYIDVSDEIANDSDLSIEERIEKLNNLRVDAQKTAEEYHDYEQSIVENSDDDSAYMLVRKR